MTDDIKIGGWPDPQRPGVPLHPERDGWHWLLGSLEAHPRPHLWLAEDGGTPCWWRPGHEVSAATMRHAAIYLGPCHTPSEATAREAAAWAAGAEAMREMAEASADCGCDVRAIVLERLASHGLREAERCCGQHYDACCALTAAALRALPLPPAATTITGEA